MVRRKAKNKKLTKKEIAELKRKREEIDKLLVAQGEAAPGSPMAVKVKMRVPITGKKPRITPPMPKLR
jgi:hypothetical protein